MSKCEQVCKNENVHTKRQVPSTKTNMEWDCLDDQILSLLVLLAVYDNVSSPSTDDDAHRSPLAW